MAEIGVLGAVAARLETLLAQRLGAGAPTPEIVSAAPPSGGAEALVALRGAAALTLEDLDLTPAAAALGGLAGAAGLDDADHHVLALVFLANLDDRIGRAIGLLHDDVSRTRPSIGLAARALDGLVPRAQVLEAAGLDSTLVHLGLVDHAGAYADPDAPVANRELVLHPRVFAALLNGGPLDSPDPRLRGALQLESARGAPAREGAPTQGSPEESAGAGAADGLLHRLAMYRSDDRPVGLLCVGPDLEAALELARDFARGQRVRVLRVELAAALAAGESPEALPRAVRRESIVLHALPVWTELPPREALAEPQLSRRLAHMFAGAPRPLLIHADYPWTPPADLPLTLVHLPTPGPAYRERVALWEAEDGRTVAADHQTAELLATTFLVPRAAVAAARADAGATAALLGGDSREHLQRAAHRQAAARLVRFATKITPRAGWPDLVAPRSVMRQLREIEWRVAHRIRVLEESGFARTASGRRGFLALFVGASGTGKTLAAEIIAGAHGFDLFKVDLAALVSKYIGETEKNLAQVFEDAEAAHAILFFDEADAVFGKRSEVRDSHDRYANLEVNYLLQRVEAYDGVVILATNMRQNMDEAFLRRLDLVVELPFPDDGARAEIWRRVWPAAVTLAPDIDLLELARRFRLSGGSIRNAAVDAAFRAVARAANGAGIRIEREDLVLAVGREYQKLGRPVTRAEFGADYASVIETLFAAPAAGENVA
ncbi:MAG: ATP-binding protein [Gemmatimonadetes bacterium]|nr:ATP-binding protein [Gemmatimonadota bacterium]